MIGDIPMRRFENQIHDREMIKAILDNTLVVHVGINDGDYPYVVPLSFGYEMTPDKLIFYLHCAREGHKVDLWEANPKVSLTVSMFTNHPNDLYRGGMHDFRSIMANGIIRKIDRTQSGSGHGRAVQAILSHNGRRPNQFSVPHYMFMAVYAVECDWKHVTAKSEEPMKHPKEVPFPTMEEIHANQEPVYDYSYFFSRKAYEDEKKKELPSVCENPDAEIMTEDRKEPLGNNGSWKFDFHWDFGEDPKENALGCDLDVLALTLDETGHVQRRYDVAFYNQKTDRSGMLQHVGDDILNAKGQETVLVNLDAAPDYCKKVVFVLAAYEADTRQQNLDVMKHLSLHLESPDGRKTEYDLLSGAKGGSDSCDSPWNGKPAAVAAVLEKTEDGSGWVLTGTDGTVFDDWHATAMFSHYGLKRWKE